MLNEWIEIHPVLRELGCDLGESHPNFNLCPRSKRGFAVYLDTNGHVEDVDIPDVSIDSVYRWNEGNHAPAFPVFNGRAFYEVTCDPSLIPDWITKALKDKSAGRTRKRGASDPERDSKEKETIDDSELQEFLDGCNDLWEEDDLQMINRCLKELPSKLQGILETAEEKPGGYTAYKELVRRAGLCQQPDGFRDEVRKILMKKLLDTGKKDFAEVLFAIKKKGKKKRRGREHGRDFLYLLTIKDWDKPEFGKDRCPPYHSNLQSWMARTFEEHSNKSLELTGQKDAFGLDMAGADQKYKDVKNAASFSKVKLFAANEDIPCLMRYGLESSALFPAGRATRELARKTLEYVLSRERRGITWRSLREYENRNTVAFAYCTKLKDTNVIKVFDNDDIDGQENIYISEEATKTALKTLEGIAKSEPAAEIVIGIIAVLDDGGNTKVLASRHYPLADYMSGAIRWQSGCANIPEVVLPWFVNKEKVLKGTLPIYPTRAIWLLNSAWRQNGEMVTRKQGSQKVPISKRFASSDALDFLFEKDETIAERVDAGLENIVEKSAQALIMAQLKADLDQNKKGDKLDFKNSEYLHMLPTLYGLLLHKKGIKKESYMKEDVFYLGRFFAVVDRLHIHYSQSERHGDIPTRLLGNDHMALALQNPQEAFVALGRRMMHPYISWAKRVQKQQGSEPKLSEQVGWCLWDITNLCQRLSEEVLPIEIDDADKAKLILGYLSYGAQKKTDSIGAEPEHKEEKEETI